jgi:hypothetical protein
VILSLKRLRARRIANRAFPEHGYALESNLTPRQLAAMNTLESFGDVSTRLRSPGSFTGTDAGEPCRWDRASAKRKTADGNARPGRFQEAPPRVRPDRLYQPVRRLADRTSGSENMRA